MKPRKSMISKKKKKSQKEIVRENVYFDEELEPVEVQMIPEDQLDLNDAELDEEFTKTLTCLDPNQTSKITHFNFKKGEFESRPNNQHIAMHIKREGVIWSKAEREELERFEKEQEKKNDDDDDKEEKEINENQETENKEEKHEENEDEKEEKEKGKKEILVKNQFNFSDRASQTFNEAMRDREVQTEPAPKSVFSQNVTASIIRDEYLKNLLKVKQQQIEEENKKKKSSFSASSTQTSQPTTTKTEEKNNQIQYEDANDAILHSSAMFDAVKIMERATVLNANSDSYSEFRYYSDSDYKRGSFVKHLWSFEYSSANQMITCLEWNAVHLDLFGAGYGSYNFNEQSTGMICIYSLKSTAYPEKIISCESGVMCMSFHPKYSSLICVGLYDGSVAVYDIRHRDYDSPIYSSKNPETHHFDPVWAIKWYSDPLQHELIFYSISSDSEIKIWKMSQNELTHETLIKLTTPKITINDGEEEEVDEKVVEDEDDDMLALCSCFDFNPFMEHLYLVGTEDGHIMECNKTYNDGFTRLYSHAHYMNVYCIKWNLFHDKIFLSCSQDWTIKLWEINNKKDSQKQEAIITYDLGSGINDIAWAPFSSTIFAAVTCDGRVHIFDLMQNKNAPLCTQQITKKSKNIKLTKVSFPIGFPLVIVGDEKGNVYALKLSPNLYLNKIKHRDILKNIHPNMFNQNDDFKQKEKEKLINVLNVTGNKVFDVIEHFSPRGKKRT